MFHSRNFKLCLIELFAYPRWLAVAKINIVQCPHNGYFDRRDRKCWKCLWATECRWIDFDNGGEVLSRKSTSELIEALDRAVNFVEDRCTHHNRKECDCHTCSWLRDARSLLKRHKTKKLTRTTNPPTKAAPANETRA